MKYLTYALFAIIGFVLAYFIFRNTNAPPKVENRLDTVYYTKYDTLREYILKPIHVKQIDSVKVQVNDTLFVYLPMEQKHYSKDSLYDCWVSGNSVNLDSIFVYNKKEYITVTDTKIIQDKCKLSIYGYAGFYMYNDKVVPKIGLTFNTTNKFSFGAKIGILDNKPIYGLSVGYKIK